AFDQLRRERLGGFLIGSREELGVNGLCVGAGFSWHRRAQARLYTCLANRRRRRRLEILILDRLLGDLREGFLGDDRCFTHDRGILSHHQSIIGLSAADHQSERERGRERQQHQDKGGKRLSSGQ